MKPKKKKNKHAGRFIGEVETRWLSDHRRMLLIKTIHYRDPRGVLWTAKKGLIFDGGSKPKVLWSIAGSPFTGPGRRAYVLHDAYYQGQDRPRVEVDFMMWEASISDGMSKRQAHREHFIVRRFGGATWRSRKKKNK